MPILLFIDEMISVALDEFFLDITGVLTEVAFLKLVHKAHFGARTKLR
jgi:hypothetical protein